MSVRFIPPSGSNIPTRPTAAALACCAALLLFHASAWGQQDWEITPFRTSQNGPAVSAPAGSHPFGDDPPIRITEGAREVSHPAGNAATLSDGGAWRPEENTRETVHPADAGTWRPAGEAVLPDGDGEPVTPLLAQNDTGQSERKQGGPKQGGPKQGESEPSKKGQSGQEQTGQEPSDREQGEQGASEAKRSETEPDQPPKSEPVKEPAKFEGISSEIPIEMNFKNVNIINFLAIMSKALNVAMVWDETKIRGTITLVSPQKFNREDTLRIFETVLAMHGFTTIQHVDSPIVQVVPSNAAPRFPSPTRSNGIGGAESNFFLTQIIPLKYADANQVRAALTPLISKNAGLAIYAPGNVLVLSDTEANINRILSIIKQMDVQPGDVDFAVITLNYASARKLAPILTTLGGALSTTAPAAAPQRGRTPARAAKVGANLKVVADERTNTLILVGPPLLLEKFKDIVVTLDVPGVIQERGIKVYRLEHADAAELVKILKDINIKSDAKATPGKPAPAASRAQVGRVTMTADKATNSLIMFGPTEVLEILDDMIAQLDIRRPQVYVEVLIMEITLEKSLKLGVQWRAAAKIGDGAIGIGFPDATPVPLESALQAGSGSAIGIVGNEITFEDQTFTSFSSFVQATQQDTDLNVLANPQLLTLNNQEAEINVSQVVPVSTRTVTNNQLQTTTEFEFKDVGIILKITPQITGENKVRLLINQESSSIATRQAATSSSQQAITTLKRKINTQVVVDDNTTMAIGGLIQDQVVESESKVPCLGDIPWIGWLFKSTSETVRKTNMIVFIRPRIIATREDMEASTNRVRERYDTMRVPEVDAESMLRNSFRLPQAPEPPAEEEEGNTTQ